MSDEVELTVKRIVDGYRVTGDSVNTVVNQIRIAGNRVKLLYSEITIVCSEWAIEGEYDPWLLIEPAAWWSPEEDDNDV